MKTILIILSIVILTSCNLHNTVQDNFTSNKIERQQITQPEKLIIENLLIRIQIGDQSLLFAKDKQGIANAVHALLVPLKNKTAKWEHPDTVIKNGYGDCKDFARLFSVIWFYVHEEEIDLIAIKNNRVIEAGGVVDHAIVRFNDGSKYDPMLIKESFITVGYSYSFDLQFEVVE